MLSGTEKNHKKVRNAIVEYIQYNSDESMTFVTKSTIQHKTIYHNLKWNIGTRATETEIHWMYTSVIAVV